MNMNEQLEKVVEALTMYRAWRIAIQNDDHESAKRFEEELKRLGKW